MSNIIQYLQDNGWKEYPDRLRSQTRCFYKRFDTPTRCHCNDDKDGISVCAGVSNWDGGSQSVELDITGELPDESWIQLKGYGFKRDPDINTIIASIPRLLAAWEVLANFNQTTTEP
jgi:hypothetical protein